MWDQDERKLNPISSLFLPEVQAPLGLLAPLCWKKVSLLCAPSCPTSTTCTCCKGALHFIVYLGPTGTRLLISGGPLVEVKRKKMREFMSLKENNLREIWSLFVCCYRDYTHNSNGGYALWNITRMSLYDHPCSPLKLYPWLWRGVHCYSCIPVITQTINIVIGLSRSWRQTKSTSGHSSWMRRKVIITLKTEQEGFKQHFWQELCKINKILFLFTSLKRERERERKMWSMVLSWKINWKETKKCFMSVI